MLIINLDDRQAIKLAIRHTKQEAEVISGFYQDLNSIKGSIDGNVFAKIQ